MTVAGERKWLAESFRRSGYLVERRLIGGVEAIVVAGEPERANGITVYKRSIQSHQDVKGQWYSSLGAVTLPWLQSKRCMESHTMQGSSQSVIGRALLVTGAAAVFWFVFIWVGAFGAMFWYVLPLAVACLLYVTTMFHLIAVSAVPRLAWFGAAYSGSDRI